MQDTPISNGTDCSGGKQITHDGENPAQTLLMKSLTKESCTEMNTIVENPLTAERLQIPHSVQNESENGCDVIKSDENATTETHGTEVPRTGEELSGRPSLETAELAITENDHNQIESEAKPSREEAEPAKFDLKPDAQEFIPKAYRQIEQIPIDQNIQYVNFSPNFIPIPVMAPMGDIAHLANYPPPFLPPGIPINFVPPPNAKLVSNFVNIVPDSNFLQKTVEQTQPNTNPAETVNEAPAQSGLPDRPSDQQLNLVNVDVKPLSVSPNENLRPRINHKTDIDIAKIVSKLEEAAKEQRINENKRQNFNRNNKYSKYRYPDKNPESPHKNNFKSNGNTDEKYNKTRNGYYNRRPLEDKNRRNFESPNRYSKHNSDIVKTTTDENVANEGKTQTVSVTEKDAQDTTNQNQLKPNEEQQGISPAAERVSLESHQALRLSLKESTPRRRISNYSDTVKNSVPNANKKCEKLEKHPSEKPQRLQLETPKEATPKAVTPQKQAKPANQWISVSSRKKRKNKGALENEETEVFLDEQEDEVESNDLFESYDVNQLVDVVPATKLQEEIKTDAVSDEVKEISKPDDLNTQKITELDENAKLMSAETSQIVMADVRDIERNLIENSQAGAEKAAEESQTIIASPVTVKLEAPEAEPSPKPSSSRKTKKNVQKQPIKRIIITDTYTAINENIPEPPVQETPIQKTTTVEDNLVVEAEEPKPAITEEPAVEEEEADAPTVVSTPEKKNKKKKKRISKTVLTKNHSVSSSNTTINNFDDTYDFLLENSLLDDSEERTNVEISQELDRMIQKGMYNNLEEKIKSMNIDALSDGFFNSLQSSDKSLEKSGFLKNPDLSSLVKSTAHLFNKPKKYEIQDFNRVNVDFSNIKLPRAEHSKPSTSKTGIFVENPEVNEILKNVCADLPSLQVPELEVEPKKTKNNGKLKNKSKKDCSKSEERKKLNQTEKSLAKNEDNVKVSEEVEKPTEKTENNHTEVKPEEKNTNLYPITQAVKEWMTKTRENTPEIEILKSPRTIYKEFCETEKAEEEETNHKIVENVTATDDKTNDEEITLFSTENWSMSRESSLEQDLLDCWDNNAIEAGDQSDSAACNATAAQNLNGKMNGTVKNLTNGHDVEAEEDSIEVYESKYGKNEDYLKIKAEMQEKKSTTGNFPRHGNLPYRAICCSVM